MIADDVVLCPREKDLLELELEQWREALEREEWKCQEQGQCTCAWKERH